MKINKIECPSCGCSFNLNEMDDNNICTCPACSSSLYIDKEEAVPSVVNININNYGNSSQNVDELEKMSIKTKIIGGIISLIIISILMITSGLLKAGIGDFNTGINGYRTTPNSEPMVMFVQKVFNKDIADITVEEYSTISYLHIDRNCPSSDWTNADKYPWKFEYSTTIDKAGNPIDPQKIIIFSDANVQKKDIQVFTNIIRAEFGEYGQFEWDDDSYGTIDYKNLKQLKYYRGDTFSSIMHAFNEPSNISSLWLDRLDIETDDDYDIAKFSGLKSLIVDYVDEYDNLNELTKLNNLETFKILYLGNEKNNTLDFLSGLTKLKTLELYFSSDTHLANANVFYGLPNIEQLSLNNIDELKNIDFIKNMPNLHHLTVDDCPIISIEPLRDNIALTHLSLNDLDNITDISVLPTLSSLQQLDIRDLDIDNKQMPTLNNLSLLTDVALNTNNIKAIKGMEQITDLRLENYYAADKNTIASLTGLQRLSIDLSSDKNIHMKNIAKLPNLYELDLYFDHYTDYPIDSIFTSPSIKTITLHSSDINNSTIVIDLHHIEDNHMLTELTMDNIEILTKNSGNTSSEQSKDIALFLEHFKALEKLSIQNNKIDSLEFVKNMSNLKFLDISGNYVSDVSPLLSCANLEQLICGNNPTSNLNLIPENVEVITQ